MLPSSENNTSNTFTPMPDNAGRDVAGAGRNITESNVAFDNSFFNIAPAKVSFVAQHAKVILIVGAVVSVALIGAGVMRQVSYQASDESGRDAARIEQEIGDLSGSLEAAEKASEAVFEQSGFSSEFYQTSQTQADIMLDKTELENTLAELNERNDNANIFNTGAIYFFLAGLVCALVTVTVFLAARRRPKSASVVG